MTQFFVAFYDLVHQIHIICLPGIPSLNADVSLKFGYGFRITHGGLTPCDLIDYLLVIFNVIEATLASWGTGKPVGFFQPH